MPVSKPGQITLEKSPEYWRTPNVPRRVKLFNPRIKLIASLRDPVTKYVIVIKIYILE